MSTEDQNRAVVTLHKGVDTQEFVNQMLDAGYQLHNEKPGSLRNFDFVMTKEQAATLREDARVIDVRYGSKVDNGIHLIKHVMQETQQYNKDPNAVVGSDHGNWAHMSCLNTSDVFSGSSITIPGEFKYTLDGTDVDVVIQDSGVQPDHPEFLASDLTTMRYQTVDWPTISGLSYTQPALFHRDIDGHGTHVASTVAGKRLGWAKNANIYSMKILDDPGNTFGVSASFEMIRAWHNLKKTNNPEGDTYPTRPTIVNMSWGYFGKYQNIQNGKYRNANWNGTTMDPNYGMVQGQQDEGVYTHPIRVASVDADVQDCLDAGIIMVGAAGNGRHKIARDGSDPDWDNYFTHTTYGDRYYHQGSTPVTQGNVICVANISNEYKGSQEPLRTSSEKGPRVDICAPGSNITGAIPAGSTKFNAIATAPHLDNNAYVIGNLTGTSMASPQVAGVLTNLLQLRPRYTQAQCLAWLQEVSQSARLYDTTTGVYPADYTDERALQGAANLYLQTPFVSEFPYSYQT